jgi:uncharacterized protein (DUF2164 family)
MTIELSKPDHEQAIASIERYFRVNRDEKIGNLEAGALLAFFLEEVAPVAYNRGVADAQANIQARVTEVDFEVHQTEFGYWSKFDKAGKGKR